jgi:formylmethanofuran dehydrogenase subunit E
MKAIVDWFIAVVFVHGWWRKHPSDWAEIKKSKDKLTQKLVNYEMLPALYARRGIPIHSIKCKECGEQWFTSCKKDLCRNIICWVKYYGRKH